MGQAPTVKWDRHNSSANLKSPNADADCKIPFEYIFWDRYNSPANLKSPNAAADCKIPFE
jgi:hypothetical protein